MFYKTNSDAEQYAVGIKKYQDDYAKQGETAPHTAEQDQAYTDYINKAKAFNDATQKTASMYLYGAVAAYVLGVGEAILDAPKSTKKSKKKKRRRYNGFSQAAPAADDGKDEDATESAHAMSGYRPRMAFGPSFEPVYEPVSGTFAPGAALQVRMDF
jgi:hypothetical protein